MTYQKHTKEPWIELYADDSTFVGVARFDVCQMIDEDHEANARRIVTCVNALAGIDDPEAFMRDVRGAFDNDDAFDRLDHLNNIEKHLKGGAE